MSNSAKVYVACILASGAIALSTSLHHWAFPNPTRFVSYFALALIASTLKVRLARIKGTFSTGFLFLLVGIAEFQVTELVLTGCGVALVQSYWRAARRPNIVQVVFNVATLATSTACSYEFYQAALALGIAERSLALLAITSLFFFLINTLLVSGMLSLVENKPLKQIWRHWYLWSFPYYLVGTAIASAIIDSDRYFDWKYSLLLLPLMLAAYVYYRMHVRSRGSETVSPM